MAERGTAQRRASVLDSVEDWIAKRNADVERLTRDAEAAGHEAWRQATRAGENLVAAKPADVLALGLDVLKGGRRPSISPARSANRISRASVREAVASGLKFDAGKAALYAGNGLGLVEGLGSAVKGVAEGAEFIHDLSTPWMILTPQGQAAHEALAETAIQAGNYVRKGVANPTGVVRDVQDGLKGFNEDTNPDATPVADSVSDEMARNFRIGRNQGKFTFDAGTFLVGGEGIKGLTLVNGVSKEARVAKFTKQGFKPEMAEHLAETYPSTNRGAHFVPVRAAVPASILGVPVPKFAVGLRPPKSFMESPLNVLKPANISRGDMYALHYQTDTKFHGTGLPGQGRGGGWSGKKLGLERYDPLGRLWYGAPPALKTTAGGLMAGGRLSDGAEQWGQE